MTILRFSVLSVGIFRHLAQPEIASGSARATGGPVKSVTVQELRVGSHVEQHLKDGA